MIFLWVLLVGLSLLLGFRLLHWGMHSLVRRKTGWRKASYLLVGLEFFLWLAWLAWGLNRLVRNSVIYTYLIIGLSFLVLGLFAWFVLRDVVAGVIFKLQHNLKLQQTVRAGDTTGTLLRLGVTAMLIESSGGERLKIPYTQLINRTIGHANTSEVNQYYDFALQVDKANGREYWVSHLQQQILLQPWSLLNSSPVVRLQQEHEQTFTFNIRVYALNAAHAGMVETYLRQHYAFQKTHDGYL